MTVKSNDTAAVGETITIFGIVEDNIEVPIVGHDVQIYIDDIFIGVATIRDSYPQISSWL